MQKKILITGGSGLLAFNWALSTRSNYAVTLLLHHKKISLLGVETDIASLSSLDECSSVLAKHQPDIVIHTAGLTNVEACEANPDLAQEVNVDLAKNIAIACSSQGVKLVHISTDHLFSGDQEFSTEESSTSPVNNYAKSKLLGEQQVLENCKDTLIVRTNFFGWGTRYRQSFSDFIISRLRSNIEIKLFQDVLFTPILITELVRKVHQLIDMNANGIFNVVGNKRLSKYEFGLKLASCFKLDKNLIKPIDISEKLQLIKRPKDMSLSNNKLVEVTGKLNGINQQIQQLKDNE